MTDERRGGWLQTSTGKAFYPIDPRPEDVDAIDIAHGLAAEPRFNGQTPMGPYSVAQHSVLVSLRTEELAREVLRLTTDNIIRDLSLVALLHDASEAYIKDIPRPLKVDLPGYEPIERRVMRVIFDRFDLGVWLLDTHAGLPPIVLRADEELLATEAAVLHPECTRPMRWGIHGEVLERYKTSVLPWMFDDAKRLWLARFNELGGEARSYDSAFADDSAFAAWWKGALREAR